MTFIVVVTSKERPRTKGLLSKLLLEIDSGVYAGRIPASSAKGLIAALEDYGEGECCVVFSASNEAGIGARVFRNAKREIVDNFGVPLVRRLPKAGPSKSKDNDSK